MKLYFSPGACCMSCHIALEITQQPFELVYVGKNADKDVRANFLTVNPLGAVPALELKDGRVLTQNIAILEYIADQKPEAHLLPPVGTFERAETMRWLSFIAADLHKAFAPLFGLAKISDNPQTQADVKKWCFANIDKYLTLINTHLQTKQYLANDQFSTADCYFFVVFQWTKAIGMDTSQYAAILRYNDHIAKMPAVVKVHEREQTASA